MAAKNPYLAYLQGESEAPENDLTSGALDGCRTRKPTGKEVEAAMDHSVSPFTGRAHTKQYKEILAKRKVLPVFKQMHKFFEMFNQSQILLLEGETGCGKTTQIPQYAVYGDLPRIQGKQIACTLPRGVGVMNVAKRVADEMDVKLGEEVGYSTCWEDCTGPSTILKYMSDETLLQELINDNMLERYSTVILDEAYERTLETDILMSLLKDIAKHRPSIKIIVMSAVLGAVEFQSYFKKAPLLKIPSRSFPVETVYMSRPAPDYIEATIQTVLKIHQTEGPGDVLVFLVTGEEVEDACRKISKEANNLIAASSVIGPLKCIPLYSSLPPQQQQLVFEPPPPPLKSGGAAGRKVVVSTNIAETSWPIDGIVYVVDSGLFRLKIFTPRTRVEALPVLPISKVSAQHRAGRAGRTRPGKCFRLYTESSFVKELEEQTDLEIIRSNLASVILKMKKAGIDDLVHFNYINPPPPEAVMRAFEALNYLEAFDDDGNLTPLGNMMAEFPLDPQLSKALISSPKFKCSNEILSIAAMLSVPSPFLRPHNQQKEADDARSHFTHPDGDHLTLLNVFHTYKRQSDTDIWCQQNYISSWAMAQADNMRRQLIRKMEHLNFDSVLPDFSNKSCNTDICMAITTGYFMQVAHKSGKTGTYITRDGQEVRLHSSCGLAITPEWVLYNEYVLSTDILIRICTKVKPDWLLELAPMYFQMSIMPEGETKRALQRAISKRGEKSGNRTRVKKGKKK